MRNLLINKGSALVLVSELERVNFSFSSGPPVSFKKRRKESEDAIP